MQALSHIAPTEEPPVQRRVLLADSNKGNRHLLAAQLSTGPGFQVDIAASLADTQRLLQTNPGDYFVAVVNVKLKDATDGSVVDLLNQASLPVIAFSLENDPAMREKMVSKFVLDYVYIKSRQHFEHIENLAERIKRSYDTTILVVEKSLAFRFYICDLLAKHCFKVIEATTEEEAMESLATHPEIRLVVTDSSQDGIDGMGLVESIPS